MYSESAQYYDIIYSFKDYAAEVQRLSGILREAGLQVGARVLDVACGTGGHIEYLRQVCQVEGLDLDPGMLAVARQRFPDVTFHQADMADFDLRRQFDAVVCLFSSIGYTRTVARLRQAVATFARHVRPGGLVVVEPWFTPQVFQPGRIDAAWVDQPQLKIARMNRTAVQDGLSILEFHYLVGTPKGIRHFQERHELGLFPHEVYMEAFLVAGLDPIHDPQGLTGRGLYLGRRPPSS